MRNLFLIFFTGLFFSALGNVQADFTADKFYGCPPLTVTFTDKSTGGASSWSWDFDNSNTSQLQNPSATFLTSGKYRVQLTVSNNGQSDSVVKTIEVWVVPTVSFSAQNTKVCLQDSARFIETVKPGSSPVVSYAWGFGDGNASSEQNAAYKYNQTGAYTVTLVVQDSNGCNANKTAPLYITVFPEPSAAFSASPATSCNTTQTVSFTNNSTGAALTYWWSLDNSATSTLQNPTYTYTQESYQVELIVTDSNGCTSVASEKIEVENLHADFKVSNPKPCTGQTVQFTNTSNYSGSSWFWDFGDGTTSTTQSPTKVYTDTGTYTVKFVIQDGACADSLTQIDYIHVIQGFSANLATFGATNTASCDAPLTVQFSNTTPGTDSSDTYSWNFGNGDTSNLQNPTENFTPPGDFGITLTITDSSGCVIKAIVGDFIKTSPPVPKFTVPGSACPGSGVQFVNKSTDATSYFWNLGDGDTTNAPNPYHIYTDTGWYNVTLIAYGVGGCDSSITVNHAIYIGNPAQASFVIKDTFSPCPPFVAVFTNTTPVAAASYKWDFGDGYTDTKVNPTHIYYHPGVFNVSLTATFSTWCASTVVKPNLITVQGPTGNFNITPTSGCTPLTVNITSSMSNTVKTFSCDMGDGAVVYDTTNFSHVYTQTRAYYPQFVLTDFVGCTVSYALDTINVHSNPVFQLHDTSVCPGMGARITIAADSNSYNWLPAAYVNCDTCRSVVLNAPDTTIFQVTGTNIWGCQTTGTMQLNVDPLPALSDSFSINLCKSDVMALTAGNSGYRYAWSPGLYLNDSIIANPVCSPLSSITYTVTEFNELGCSTDTKIAVNVRDTVVVALPSDTTACMNSSIQLKASIVFGSAAGVQYAWSPREYFDNAYIANPQVSVGDAPEKLTLVVTSGHCASDTQYITVASIAVPDLEVPPSVTTTPGATVPLWADSHQELTYQWVARDSLSCPTCRRTDVFPNSSQIVYVSGTNERGCTVTDSVAINIEGCDGKSIFMPNTFTPNGDGVDDKFYIRTTAISSLKYFRIFDSWGQQVFETTNVSEGWDGSIKGKPAPIAVYVYELEGKCENGYDIFKSGTITAIR